MGRQYASRKWNKRNDRVFVCGSEDCYVALKRDGTVTYVGRELYQDSEYPFPEEICGWKDIMTLACENSCLLGLKRDGTVELAPGGWDFWEVKKWKDIADIDIGHCFVVGLTADGRVVKTGEQYDGVDSWSDIAGVTACRHVVGLKKDGTVVAAGDNRYGQCEVSEWRDIVTVACGSTHTVGLKSDGTVVAAGGDPEAADVVHGKGVCDVSGWTDIVDIAADADFTIGLKADGTVVAAGKCPDLSEWRDIAAVSVSNGKIFGIRRDGRVIGLENEEGWRDIVAVRQGWRSVLGMRKDGAAVVKVLWQSEPGATYLYSDGYKTDEIERDLSYRWENIAVEPEEF